MELTLNLKGTVATGYIKKNVVANQIRSLKDQRLAVRNEYGKYRRWYKLERERAQDSSGKP